MSKREDVLNALFEQLKQINDVKVLKNEPLPQKIPKNGIIFLRDGNVGEPEVLLSPPCFIYQHVAEIEIVVQALKAEERDKKLDELMAKIGALISENTTLGGLVDYCLSGQPEFILEAPEGVVPMKAAVIPIVLEYSTETSLI